MKKIKDELVKKMYKSNLTQDELLFLFQLFQISNIDGICNIYYKDMANIIHCSISNFYNIISSLKNKGFITFVKCKECKQEITVNILNNNFNTKNKFKNYIDLNFKVFDINLLKTLRAGSIKLLLYSIFRILKQRSRKSHNDINKLIYRNIKSICLELNISERMLKEYFNELNKVNILNLSIKQDKNNKTFKLIEIDSDLLSKPTIEITEKSKTVIKTENSIHRYYTNIIKNLCRRKNINYTERNLNDVAILMNQYWKIAISNNKDIVSIINNVFSNLEKELNSIVVHKIIKVFINHSFTNKYIIY